ncbi:hypothetical protein [Burkholderia sp. RF2-non_BP3]|uniref:hypothetical protein n=1 Tax=Burkholderia sp. RF2-non_BP3 TaxID=1637844 RepID=UPI0012E3B33B|nr:hypothetical protein [Burkholderia sp. RF2-non_BP3]
MAMWVDVRVPAGVTLIRIGFLVGVVLSAHHPGRSKARRHVRRVFHWIRRATPARRSTRDLHGIDREIRERVMHAAGPERRPAAMKDGDAVAHGHSGARINGGMAVDGRCEIVAFLAGSPVFAVLQGRLSLIHIDSGWRRRDR